MNGYDALKERIEEFLLAVCICHHAKKINRSKYNKSELHFKTIYPEEISQLDFAYRLGFAFKSRDKDIINITRYGSNQGYNLRFEEIFTRRLKIKGEWVTATVVKGNYGEGGSIYFRGPHHLINLMLQDNSRSNAYQKKAEAKQFESRGFLQQSFAKRSIDDSTMENLIKLVNEIKVGNSPLESELIE